MNNVLINEENILDVMLKRFSNGISACRRIDEQIAMCRALMMPIKLGALHSDVVSERTIAYNTLILHLQLATSKLRPESDNIDDISEYLDSVSRGNQELLFSQEKALRATLELPDIVLMIDDLADFNKEAQKLAEAANDAVLSADNVLTREVMISDFICNLVSAAKSYVKKNTVPKKAHQQALASLLSATKKVIAQNDKKATEDARRKFQSDITRAKNRKRKAQN